MTSNRTGQLEAIWIKPYGGLGQAPRRGIVADPVRQAGGCSVRVDRAILLTVG